MFRPRVQGVLDFLVPHAQENEELARWMTSHPVCLEEACDAVGSIYVEEAARMLNRIRYAVNDADPEWEKPGTLSQKADPGPAVDRRRVGGAGRHAQERLRGRCLDRA